MKILFVITGLFPGGAERIVLELVRHLTASGHCCSVVSLLRRPGSGQDVLAGELERTAHKVYYLDAGLKRPFALWELRKILKEEKPHVIHGHLMHGNLASRLAALGSSVPVINTIHIAEKRSCFKVRILFGMDRLTRWKCTVCTAVSHAAARWHEKMCHWTEGTIKTVYNGSDPVRKSTQKELDSFRNRFGLDKADRIIGSAGRLDPQKGYDIFFNTLEDLHTLVPEKEKWAILLMGDGPERERLEILGRTMEKCCPRLKIVLTGYLPDAASFLPVLDLFVMPSRYEGYGLALTEAVSCGIPCLCSNADSLPELCALVPENTFCCDFVPGEMKEIYEKALSLPRTEGKVLCDCSSMTEDYLRLYRQIAEKS